MIEEEREKEKEKDENDMTGTETMKMKLKHKNTVNHYCYQTDMIKEKWSPSWSRLNLLLLVQCQDRSRERKKDNAFSKGVTQQRYYDERRER